MKPGKPVTIKSIAQELGLSVSAVSKALNDYPDIGEETRRVVINKALEMGYSPNLMAQSLVKKVSNSIGVIIRDINTIYGEMLKPLSQEAQKNNLILIMADCNRNEELQELYIKQMIASRVKALIIAPVSNNASKILSIVNNQLPVIFLGGMANGANVNLVCTDVKLEARMSMDYLLGLGHRKIAFIGAKRKSTSYGIRHDVYMQSMRAHDLQSFAFIGEEGLDLFETGYQEGMKAISDDNGFTALFCASDYIAVGAMKAIQEKGLKIPEDISIIASVGQNITSIPTINLTTVSMPKEDMAKHLIMICQNQADNPYGEREQYYATPSLIERGSCRRI